MPNRIRAVTSISPAACSRTPNHNRSPTQNSHLVNTHRYQLTTPSCIVLQLNSSLWWLSLLNLSALISLFPFHRRGLLNLSVPYSFNPAATSERLADGHSE
jgi:hypothetical protein